MGNSIVSYADTAKLNALTMINIIYIYTNLVKFKKKI